MSVDLRDTLHRAAAMPVGSPPVDAIATRGRRFRALRYAAIATAMAVILGAGAALWRADVVDDLFGADIDPAQEDSKRTAETTRLPAITLTADLTKSTKWPSGGIFIPFGPSEDQLAYEPSNESAALVPDSFAVAPDGTFWITDFGKNRLVHYSQDGNFLGDISAPDSPVGSRRAFLDDIVFVEDRAFITLSATDGRVAEISLTSGEQRGFTITHEERALAFSALISAAGNLYAEVFGYADSYAEEGPSEEFVKIRPDTGEAVVTPTIALGNGTEVAYESFSFGQGRFSLLFSGERDWVQPLRFRGLRNDGKVYRPTVAGVGTESMVPGNDEVAFFVLLTSDLPKGDNEGGQWLLRVEDPNTGSGGVRAWEALPEQVWLGNRHLCWGPDGVLYAMLRSEEGATIVRYP